MALVGSWERYKLNAFKMKEEKIEKEIAESDHEAEKLKEKEETELVGSVQDAINAIGIGPYQWRLLIFVGGAYALNAMQTVMMVFLQVCGHVCTSSSSTFQQQIKLTCCICLLHYFPFSFTFCY